MIQTKKMSRKPLTSRQLAFYDQLVAYVKEHRHMATQRAMADVMQYKSVESARKMIVALGKKGWLLPRPKGERVVGVWPAGIPIEPEK